MREKLIELLESAESAIYWDSSDKGFIEKIADYLIANGATIPVRCKDCKHGIWDEEEQMWECVLPVNLTGDLDTYRMFREYNDGEHFCSYGERKEQ